jgi:hypothetical protein
VKENNLGALSTTIFSGAATDPKHDMQQEKYGYLSYEKVREIRVWTSSLGLN